jgi:uncharacterized protein
LEFIFSSFEIRNSRVEICVGLLQIVRSILISLGFLLCLVSSAPAEPQLPDSPNTYVSDFAQILSVEQRGQLEKQLSDIEKTGSSQVLVVTIPDLQDLPIEEYGIRLAEKWKPGHQGRDNGVILLVAPKDRKLRIEVGYGLEGVLTDALSKNIIATGITPAFRGGDFFTGIQNGVQSISQAIAGEYEALPTGRSGNGGVPLPLGIFFIIFLVVLGRALSRARPYGIDHGTWHRGTGAWSSGGSSWGGGSSGGGFSSGGGSFGGGGSSGSW